MSMEIYGDVAKQKAVEITIIELVGLHATMNV